MNSPLAFRPVDEPSCSLHLQLAALDPVGDGVAVRTGGQGRGLIEKLAGVFDDLGAARRVVAHARFQAFLVRDHVGAVERVVQRAPARVGRVQRIAGVEDGHHQLRAGLQRQFGVHVGGGAAHVGGRRHQVADLFQERAIGRHVADRAGIGLVPAVQLALQPIPLGQQGQVPGRQVGDDGVEAFPEFLAGHAGVGQDLVLDEAVQLGVDLQAVNGGARCHGCSRD